EQRLELRARPIGGRSDGGALLRLERADAAQQHRQLGLASEKANAHLLELLRRTRLADLHARLSGELLDALDHDVRTLDDAGARAGRRVSSYSATVAAIAALSDCEEIEMRALRSHACTTSAGRPSRSAPTSTVHGSSIAPPSSCSLARGVSATRAPDPSVEDAASASALTSWQRAPPSPEPARRNPSSISTPPRSAAAIRSSPSAAKRPLRSRSRLRASLRSAFRRWFAAEVIVC